MKHHLLLTLLLLACACSADPRPDAYGMPEFEMVSVREGAQGEVTFTCRMSSMLQLTGYGLYYAKADDAETSDWDKAPGDKTGEDTFSVSLGGLAPGTTYTYCFYISNGRKEARSSSNHYTVPE